MEIRIMLFILMMMVMPVSYAACYSELSVQHNLVVQGDFEMCIRDRTLGATLVVSFSLGLALTLVTVGVGAAISVQQVAKRWSGFNTLAKRAPYFSSLLIGLVGVYMGVHLSLIHILWNRQRRTLTHQDEFY